MNPKALHKISYGLYVVSSMKNSELNAQIANTVFQVASTPMTIAVSINKQNLTHEFIRTSKVFTASVLCQATPLSFIGNFGFKSGREVNKFKEINYRLGKTGAPIVIDNATAYIEAKVKQEIDVGSHTVFIGEVVDSEVLSEEPCMTYAYYHEIKRGVTPKTAATYIPERPDESKAPSAKYVCTICGYIYDPENGDPDSGIRPGTSFEALPDSWVCPMCGATKDKFQKQ